MASLRVYTSVVNPKNGRAAPMISQQTYEAIMENKDLLDSAIIYDRDFQYNYVSRPSSFSETIFYGDLTKTCTCKIVRFQDARAILPPPYRWQDC